MLRSLLTAALVLDLFVSLSAALGAGQGPVGAATGRSIWDGVFTDDQAERGRRSFLEKCSMCHGEDLRGGEGKPLVADRFWGDWRGTTVDYLLGQISRNMPYSMDGSLAGSLPMNTYVDIVAHILRSNGFPAGSNELTPRSAAGVQIAQKGDTGELPASTLVRVVGCLTGDARAGWRLVKATRPVREMSPSQATASATSPLGDREFALKFVLTPLNKFAGYKMTATGLLIGDGGVDGLNVSTITPVAEKCE